MQHVTDTGLDRVFRLVDASACISFDLFDTLVRRRGLFFPKDLFQIVESVAIRRIGRGALGYADKRVEAESASRADECRRGRMETDLTSIYSRLALRMPLSEKEISLLKSIELDCERDVLERDPFVGSLYGYAVSCGKAVVITTDTYFDESFIEEICKRFGFGQARLFVSSTFGKVKHDGSLFRVLIKKTGLPAAQILHLGDNPFSDITAAASAGLKTWHYLSEKRDLQSRLNLSVDKSGSAVVSSILCEIADASNNAVQNDSDLSNSIGKNLAFLLLGFTAWLYDQLRALKGRRIYFIAREGLILKRCFDAHARQGGDDFESRYLIVSRASLYPSLIFSDPKLAIELFTRSWGLMRVGSAVARLSLRIDEMLPALRKHGFSDVDERLTPSTHNRFRAFLRDNWPAIKNANRQKRENTLLYLEQERFLEPEDAVLVDIGWHLTLQRCLDAMSTGQSVKRRLSGRYLGTFGGDNHQPTSRAAGYLATCGEPRSMADLLKCGPPLIELLLGAPHGTVLEYSRTAGRAEPVFEENPLESRLHAEIVAPIQSIALDKFDAWTAAIGPNNQFSIASDLCAGIGLRMVSRPSLAEALLLGKLHQSQDFRGSMKSITGIAEWDLGRVSGDLLPDGTIPMWKSGFEVLRATYDPKR